MTMGVGIMERAIRGFLDAEGRLKQYPARRKPRLLALGYLASKLEADRRYTERELGERLDAWHTFGDRCLLRRELYDFGFLDRERDGSSYQLSDPQPDPTAIM